MIESWLDENITGYIQLGREATGDCPLCGKPRDHFYIHVAHDTDARGRERHGRWICFSCGEKGDFWRLLGLVEGMSSSAAKAWWITQAAERPASPDKLKRLKNRVALLKGHRARAHPERVGLPFGFSRVKRRRPVMLSERGVGLETARAYGLGYCAEGDAAGRVVFPIRCPLGTSWTARATDRWARPKYLSGPGAGQLLYGWDVAFRDGPPRRIAVCEGPMDVLSLHQAGVHAVGLMSKAINDARAALLRSTGAELVVVLDSEARTEAVKVASVLGGARVVLLDKGDPGDTASRPLASAVASSIAQLDATCRVYRDRVGARRARHRASLR